MTDRYFTCSECGGSFGSRRVLEQHNRKAHRGRDQANRRSKPDDRDIVDI
jgi:hypothetical protein